MPFIYYFLKVDSFHYLFVNTANVSSIVLLCICNIVEKIVLSITSLVIIDITSISYLPFILKVGTSSNQRWIQGGARRARGPLFLLPFVFFWFFSCNHFEELQTVLFKVELIIKGTLMQIGKSPYIF